MKNTFYMYLSTTYLTILVDKKPNSELSHLNYFEICVFLILIFFHPYNTQILFNFSRIDVLIRWNNTDCGNKVECKTRDKVMELLSLSC